MRLVQLIKCLAKYFISEKRRLVKTVKSTPNIVKNNLKIASVYGEIKQNNEQQYYLTGEQRTGCVACILGMENERKCEKNRIQRLKEIEPKKYDYVVNRLGFKQVLEYMNYKY